MLTPVSFRKGRAHAPRLSEPYVPGVHHPRYWREEEIDLVRRHYAEHGMAYCLSRLPGRTSAGVYNQAHKLGLVASRTASRSKPLGASLDETIRERWPGLTERGAVAALADELGVKRHTLSTRALKLGLTLPHRKEAIWTAAEEDLLRRAPANNLPAASQFFAAHGFRRSPASIGVRCQRMGVSRRLQGVLSARATARILGVNAKTVTSWCIDGTLAATRRGTQRLPQQGGDFWTIQPADLRRFVIDQLDRIDIRKVDKHAFVTLLVAGASAQAVAEIVQHG